MMNGMVRTAPVSDYKPVLLLSEIFPPRTGGSGRWFWEMYRRFPREDVVIAAGQSSAADAFDRTHDLRVHRLPLTMSAWGVKSFKGLWGYWRAARVLSKLVRREGVGMIHCGRCLPEGVMALVLKWRYKLPYLCYVHGEDVTTATYSREHAWLVRRVLANAETLIANSHNTAGLLTGLWNIPAAKVHVLHPGVDTRYFQPAEHNLCQREALGWGNRPVLLTVGRLQRRKGHDVLIRALRLIRRAVPNVLYSVVGDGEERARLEALVQEVGVAEHVQFQGETSDAQLLHCYQQCDVFVLPNRQEGKDIEGFGMVLLEAQSCGKPVVAGASGGTAETMRVPETGRVVDCKEPERLADLLSGMLIDRSLRQRMGHAGRAWTVSRFDWEALRTQAEGLFRSVGQTAVPPEVRELVNQA
jgi:phosphatidylinositol alpha-1,6-mannosyltransferase